MNRHLKQHSQRLNIKTTHLASLTAIFRPKKQPKPPTANRSHPPTADMNQDDHLAGPGGSEVTPEVSTSQPGDIRSDDGTGSDGDEMSEGAFGDPDSDEFESDEEDLGCETTEGRVPLDFELNAAKAGNVHHGHEILTKN
jgi:hypothetical protein